MLCSKGEGWIENALVFSDGYRCARMKSGWLRRLVVRFSIPTTTGAVTNGNGVRREGGAPFPFEIMGRHRSVDCFPRHRVLDSDMSPGDCRYCGVDSRPVTRRTWRSRQTLFVELRQLCRWSLQPWDHVWYRHRVHQKAFADLND